MKKNWGFLAALGLLALVGGAVAYLLMEDQKTPASAPPSENRLFADDLKGLARASVTRAGEAPVKLVQAVAPPSPEAGIGEWRIETPNSYRADVMAVGEWLGTLRTLEAERLLEADAQQGAAFGLDNPMLRIELGEGAGSRTLEIGAMNPTGSARYARLSGAPKIYLLPLGSITTLNKSLGEFRQKRALDLTEFAVEKLRIDTPGGTREIVRTPTRDWTFAAPPGFRADQTLLSEFVSTVVSARADAALLARDSLPEAQFAAMAPVATITATLANGEKRAEFRRAKDNAVYAKAEDLSGIYPVQTEIETYLSKPVEEFRNKKLFDFGFADVFTLRFDTPSRKLMLTKPNEQWQLDGKATDSAKANKLLDELRSATATAYLDGEAPGSVVATVSLETAGGSKEQVELHRDGTACFAVRVGEKGYYKLPENVLQDIEKAAAEIQPGEAR